METYIRCQTSIFKIILWDIMKKKTQCLLVSLVSLASPHGYALTFSLSVPDKGILVLIGKLSMVSALPTPWLHWGLGCHLIEEGFLTTLSRIALSIPQQSCPSSTLHPPLFFLLALIITRHIIYIVCL